MTTYYSDNISSVSLRAACEMMRKTVAPPFRWPIDYDQYVKAEVSLGYRGRMPWRMALEVRKTGVNPKEE